MLHSCGELSVLLGGQPPECAESFEALICAVMKAACDKRPHFGGKKKKKKDRKVVRGVSELPGFVRIFLVVRERLRCSQRLLYQ